MHDTAQPLRHLPAAAVLVAHGPTGQTLTALRRLAAVVADPDKIVVVAGTEPGLTATTRAHERGALIVDDHGPAALSNALARVAPESAAPVLVIHDDVEATLEAIERMAVAAAESGLVAIPSDQPTGQPTGALSEVNTAKLSCAVGRADRLGELALRSAFGPGVTTTGPFTQASNTAVLHTGDCQNRLVEAQQIVGAVLVAAMIVRDEADNIESCLASLHGIVDRVEIADTGSTDDTVALARAAGANVIEIGWRDDFGWARNHVLERCQDATAMLWIDADERLECADRSHLRRLLSTYGRLHAAYSVRIDNVDGGGAVTHSFMARRIADPALIRFEGALHEQPVRTDGAALLDASLGSISITHYGYAEEVVGERDKSRRNLEIARASFAADPSEQHAVHYARSLKAASTDPDETIAAVEPLIDLVKSADVRVQSLMLSLRAELLLAADRLEDAEVCAREALVLVPADAVAGAVLAESLMRCGAPAEALAAAADFSGRPSPMPLIDDHVAARTRAHALFDAAIEVQDFDAALGTVAALAGDVDPWQQLARHVSTDWLRAQAGFAGGLDDLRYMIALATSADLRQSDLAVAEADYRRAGGEIPDHPLLVAVRRELALVDEAPDRRGRFVKSPSPTLAVVYAEALVAGHIDLSLELQAIGDHDAPIGAAFGIAAEANRRRGRNAEAVSDATLALDHWKGSLHAAIVAAEAARSAADPRAALAVVHETRRSADYERAARGRRHELSAIAAQAHLDREDVASAVGESVEIVDSGDEIRYWGQLLETAGDDRQLLTLVLGLALLDSGDDFLDAAARTLSPERTAEICGAYLEVGGENPNAVSTGVLASVLTGRNDLGRFIAGFADLVPADVRDRLQAHVANSGATEVAARLADQPVS